MTELSHPVNVQLSIAREGNFIVAHCCALQGGHPHFFDVRVDVVAIANAIRSSGLGPKGDSINGFGSWLKKAVKKVAKIKIVKGIVNGVKKVAKVVKSPVFLGALSLVPGVGLIGVAASVSSAALGAMSVASKTIDAVKTGVATVKAAQGAVKSVTRGKIATQLLSAGKVPAPKLAAVKQIAAKAAATKKVLTPVASKKLASNVVTGRKVQAQLGKVATAARAGNQDARLTAAVIARTAKMHDQIAAAGQRATGGSPGLVITAEGRVMAGKKWIQSNSTPTASSMVQTLYRGVGTPPLRGGFSAVSGAPGAVGPGPAWGGHRDPGDEIDGPIYPARYDDPEAWPHVVSGLPKAWGPVHADPEARRRARAELVLAGARHELAKAQTRLRLMAAKKTTKVGNMSDLPPEMSQYSEDSDPVGAELIGAELIGCGMPGVSGFPGHLFTQSGLRNPQVRARFSAAIKRMTPKMRRRVMGRLRAAVSRNRIAGSLRGAMPLVGSHYSNIGWSGMSVNVGSHYVPANGSTP